LRLSSAQSVSWRIIFSQVFEVFLTILRNVILVLKSLSENYSES
jgi:hypothetical protein